MKNTYEKTIIRHLDQLLLDPDFGFIQEFKNHFPKGTIFLVGGGVRDIILGREVKDYDFVVRNVDTKQFELFLSDWGTSTFTGKKFGVYKFVPKNSMRIIDIAFPRTEESTGPGYYEFIIVSDPSFSIEEDLDRRDFTINALAFDVDKKKLIDTHGGLVDIEKKRIKTVGDPHKRFKEDYTRILRAVRQACQLDFDIESSTSAAILEEVPHLIAENHPVVPFEMISQEFFKSMLAAPKRTIELFDSLGLLAVLLPEVYECKGVTQPRDTHPEGDLFIHILIVLSKLPDDASLRLILGALFHDIGKPDTMEVREVKGKKRITFYNHPRVGVKIFERLAKRMKYPTKLMHDVSFLIEYHLFLWQGAITEMRPTTIANVFFDDMALGNDLITLHRIDISDDDPEKSKKLKYLDDAKQYIEDMKQKLVEADQNKIVLPITGTDVMRAFSLSQGPKIGELLEKAKEYYIEKKLKGNTMGKKELLDFLNKKYGSEG